MISMEKSSCRKIFVGAAFIAVFGLIILLFLFGRFFPFSPIVTGFEKMAMDKAVIFYRENDFDHEFDTIDSLIVHVEQFHKLKFKKKAMIFLTGSDEEYRRLTGTAARFVTQPVEGRIFISRRARNEYRNKTIRFDTYLKHELSHSILYQNMSFIHSLTYPAWFMEGVAMVSADQVGTDGYFSYNQVKEKLREGFFVDPEDWGTIISPKGKSVRDCPVENKFWFIYSEYALFVDELIVRYGKEKLTGFIKDSLNEKNFYGLFNETFGMNWGVYVKSMIDQSVHKTPGVPSFQNYSN